MAKVTVKDAIAALGSALAKLKELPEDLEVLGNFDEGGYTDCSFPLKKLRLDVEHYAKAEIDADYDEDDPDRPDEHVSLTAVFYSKY